MVQYWEQESSAIRQKREPAIQNVFPSSLHVEMPRCQLERDNTTEHEKNMSPNTDFTNCVLLKL